MKYLLTNKASDIKVQVKDYFFAQSSWFTKDNNYWRLLKIQTKDKDRREVPSAHLQAKGYTLSNITKIRATNMVLLR